MGNCCKCLQKDDDEERLIGDDSDSGLLLFFSTMGLFLNSVARELLVFRFREIKFLFVWPGQSVN